MRHPELAVRFVGAVSFAEVVEAALGEVLARGAAAAALVWVADDRSHLLHHQAAGQEEVSCRPLGEDGGAALTELFERKQGFTLEEIGGQLAATFAPLPITAARVVPILFGRRARGLLVAGLAGEPVPAEPGPELLEDLGTLATTALKSGVRYDRLKNERERLEELRQLLLDTQSNLLKEKQHIERLALDLHESKGAVVEAKEYTDNIIGSMLDLLLVVDDHGVLRRVNPATCEVLGYREDELLGRPVKDVVAQGAEIFTERRGPGAWHGGRVRDHDLTLRTQSGELVPVSLSGAILHGAQRTTSVVGVARDMRAIRRLIADLDQIFNGAPVGMRLIDLERRVLSHNAAMSDMSAVPRGLREMICTDQFRSAQCSNGGCVLRRILEGVNGVDVELDMEAADGRLIPCRLQATPFRDPDGKIIGLIEVFSNVSQQRQMTNELLRSNKELQDFAYVASHDLQEPLRKIRAFGDRLATKCGAELSEQGQDYLSRMQRAAERMQSLITNLLTFSRVTSKAQPFARVDLARVVREAIEDFDVRLQETGGHVDVRATGVIDADSLQLRQLVHNLVGNALKFHRQGVPPHIRITGECGEDGGYRLAVIDNGIGFEEKYTERIFGIFQRLHTRGEYEGTGIGLAICRKIAERHGGSITVRSQPGVGSTFLVTLPVRQREGEVAR